MKNRYLEFRSRIDREALMRRTEALYDCERGQTHSCYRAAAEKARALLREAAIPEAEAIAFPADGKTACCDRIMPLAWEASQGKLTILAAPRIEPGFIAADFSCQPFNLIKGSTATAPGGEILRLVTENDIYAGADPRRAMVMFNPGSGPMFDAAIPRLLDLGVRGFVSDYAMNADDDPDGVQWCNAFTEGANWHTIAGERDFVAFSVAPAVGRRLRCAAELGEVKVRVESDGRRFADSIDVVTARVPGRKKQEFWLFAHLYEPLANDNSSGVAAAIEIARLIREQGTPEYSLRVIFGLEMYGFAAYAATHGTSNVIGACDCDAMYLRREWRIDFRVAQPASPFSGNFYAAMLAHDLADVPGAPGIDFRNAFPCMYDDDTFLGDATTHLPTVWPIRTGHAFWHNSHQTPEYIEPDAFASGTAVTAAFTDAVVNPAPELFRRAPDVAQDQLRSEPAASLARRIAILDADLADFERDFPAAEVAAARRRFAESAATRRREAGTPPALPDGLWRRRAAAIVIARQTPYPLYDQALAPLPARRVLPGRVIYGPLAAILADTDGRRNLAELIAMVEAETRQTLSDRAIREQISALRHLAEYGYLAMADGAALEVEDIAGALRRTGVKRGDLLLIHAALGAFGPAANGADTFIAALREVLGSEGTALFAAFTYPFCYIGAPNRLNWYRPFDAGDSKAIWTGALPRRVLELPDAERSRHITHSWCGFGKFAHEALMAHEPYDAPMAESAPLGFALRHGGKIVHLGSGLGSTTLCHYVEDRADLPGLEPALCRTLRPDGSTAVVTLPRQLPGHRDFYRADGGKFFRRALEHGLEIRRAPLGGAEIMTMEMKPLYDIGMRLAAADRFVMLCDDPGCSFCRAQRGKSVETPEKTPGTGK